MSSEWLIVTAAAVVIAIGTTQMISGAATEQAKATEAAFAGIPTFGAAPAASNAAEVEVDR